MTEPEIECRIAEISRQGTGLNLLLYKTARTDAALLDETYGPDKWQNDFKMLDGKLYGGIGIKFGDEWIWRWDCGTESNMEAEKGQASDAFKRAGFKWGLGAELYTAPRITVPASKCNIKEYGGKFRCYDNFEVEKIEYTKSGNISALRIKNTSTGVTAFDMAAKEEPAKEEPAEQPPEQALTGASPEANTIYYCVECGQAIMPYHDTKGKLVSAERHAKASQERFGAVYCLDCINKRASHENAG